MEFNDLGGIVSEDQEELRRAKYGDLITLPEDVEGTNCFNCKFIINKKKKYGYCNNKHIKQYVNSRQCCSLWSHDGEYRQFKGRDHKYQ